MSIITISRQYGSGGDEIASRVCEILGYQHFDKSLITQITQEVGLSEQEIIDYSEENHKVRSFLDRIMGRSAVTTQTRIWKEDPSGARRSEEFQISEEAALTLVQKAVRSAYQTGNIVIVGRAGQIILQDDEDVLHVRIEAPLEHRIQRVKEQVKNVRKLYTADIEQRRDAQDLIFERDAASADYISRFYHADWEDPRLYHLIINTGKLTIDQAANLIVHQVTENQPA